MTFEPNQNASPEERLGCLETIVVEVLSNHIPHILEDIREIRRWVKGTALAVGAAVLAFVVDHFLGK
jgi:hypothetical protein